MPEDDARSDLERIRGLLEVSHGRAVALRSSVIRLDHEALLSWSKARAEDLALLAPLERACHASLLQATTDERGALQPLLDQVRGLVTQLRDIDRENRDILIPLQSCVRSYIAALTGAPQTYTRRGAPTQDERSATSLMRQRA